MLSFSEFLLKEDIDYEKWGFIDPKGIFHFSDQKNVDFKYGHNGLAKKMGFANSNELLDNNWIRWMFLSYKNDTDKYIVFHYSKINNLQKKSIIDYVYQQRKDWDIIAIEKSKDKSHLSIDYKSFNNIESLENYFNNI